MNPIKTLRLAIFFFPVICGAQSQKESAYVNEVNLVRTQPSLYAMYIRNYVRNSKLPPSSIQLANEIIAVLDTMKPLQPLEENASIYNSLKNHKGIDSTRMTVKHDPLSRLRSLGFTHVAENISFGRNIRYSVIQLLIDDGVASKAHRLHILSPEFTYTAVRKLEFGKRDEMDQRTIWIEDFARKSDRSHQSIANDAYR